MITRDIFKSMGQNKVVQMRVKFIKKSDQSLRTMRVQMSLSSYINPESKGLTHNQKIADVVNNNVRVTDMDIAEANGYMTKKEMTDYQINGVITKGCKIPTVKSYQSPYRTVPIDNLLYVHQIGQPIAFERSSLDSEFKVIQV